MKDPLTLPPWKQKLERKIRKEANNKDYFARPTNYSIVHVVYFWFNFCSLLTSFNSL